MALPASIAASFIRGGTSKGVFIQVRDLPRAQSLWPRIFYGLMGSPCPLARQLNGLGGGTSSTSKICVVSRACTGDGDRIDGGEGGRGSGSGVLEVELRFVQVGVKEASVDVHGTCGNLMAAVPVFAIDQGIITVPKFSAPAPAPSPVPTSSTLSSRSSVLAASTVGRDDVVHHGTTSEDGAREVVVTVHDINTSKKINTSVMVNPDGTVSRSPRHACEVSGVSGLGVRVVCEYTRCGGTKTGKLLPTGNTIDGLALFCIDGTSPESALDHCKDRASERHETVGEKEDQKKVRRKGERVVRASLVDGPNPAIFITATDLLGLLTDHADTATTELSSGEETISAVSGAIAAMDPDTFMDASETWGKDAAVLRFLEEIRLRGVMAMGLATTMEAAAQYQAVPKLCILHPSSDAAPDSEREGERRPQGQGLGSGQPSLVGGRKEVKSVTMSMGVPHRAIPVTISLSLAIAVRVPGTIPNRLARATHSIVAGTSGTDNGADDGANHGPDDDGIRVWHPTGYIDVDAQLETPNGITASVVRSVKTLMSGQVYL